MRQSCCYHPKEDYSPVRCIGYRSSLHQQHPFNLWEIYYQLLIQWDSSPSGQSGSRTRQRWGLWYLYCEILLIWCSLTHMISFFFSFAEYFRSTRILIHVTFCLPMISKLIAYLKHAVFSTLLAISLWGLTCFNGLPKCVPQKWFIINVCSDILNMGHQTT